MKTTDQIIDENKGLIKVVFIILILIFVGFLFFIYLFDDNTSNQKTELYTIEPVANIATVFFL